MKKLACIMFITILSLNISYASDEAEGLTDTENVIYFDDVELDVDSDVVIEDISKNLENVEITTDNSENSTIDVEKLLGDLILTSNYTYYYGDLCPHCLNVDEYLTENDLYNKLNITKKEVWNDIKNAEEMKITLERLGLDVEKSGVPFIVGTIEKKEFPLPMGDRGIIEYFGHVKEVLDGNFDNTSYFNDYLAREKPNLTVETTTTTETNRTILIIVFVILAVVIPTLLIKLNNR